MRNYRGIFHIVIFSLAMLTAPLFAHDYWLEPEEVGCYGLAGLLGGGGGGSAINKREAPHNFLLVLGKV